MTRIEVSAIAVCARCDGLGKNLIIEPQKTFERECPACGGTGETRQVAEGWKAASPELIQALRDRLTTRDEYTDIGTLIRSWLSSKEGT